MKRPTEFQIILQQYCTLTVSDGKKIYHKKLLKPLTASFLALIISGCSSAPEAISGGLVSADFEISQSADTSASQNDRSEEDLTPEERSAKAREKLISLGNGNVLCDIDDNVDTVEYNVC